MTIPTKTLRTYQVRLITDVCRQTGDVLVEQPTGSGKTIQIVTLIGMQLGRRFSHAIIAAPQEQIEQGFVHRDYHAISFPETVGVAQPRVDVPGHLIWGARQSKQLGSVKRLLVYFKQPAPQDHALACTHAALNRLTADTLPPDLSGKALFIDEAHHASADGLGQVVSQWRDRGGQLYFFTATPYRGDGRPVALEDMQLFRRSLAEHMADGFAPRLLESEIVALGQPGDAVTSGQFSGEQAPPSSYFDGLVFAIYRRWIDDGRPKTIVRVPPMRGGSHRLVGRLHQALSENGTRVLDATGTGPADKKRFLSALKSEQNGTFAASQYDVMIGIQRVLEGTDWPVCSAVYCVGMPGSLNTVVQLLGRAMRPKDGAHPADHRNCARLVFFVPCAGGAALSELSLDHSRHALLTCCFLADHQVGQEWIVLREVRRGIEEALGKREDNPAAADAENQADQPLEPEIRAEVELTLAAAREQIVGENTEPTLGQVVEHAAKARPDLPQTAMQRVAAEILVSQPDAAGENARDVIHQEIARRLRIDPQVKKAMEEAFAVVLDEFRYVTLSDTTVLENVRRQLHGVTGGQMREFSERLRNALPRPLTEEMILEWADAHFEKTSCWPNLASGVVLDAQEENWSNIDQLLQQGLRGLGGGSSLAKLLAANRGVRNRGDLPELHVDQILAWADAHNKRTGQWPRQDLGPIIDSAGETWKGVDMALVKGHRGLTGGSSLAKLLTEEREVTSPSHLPPLTEDQILIWADEHNKRTGDWPTQSSGSVPNTRENWSAIHQALSCGHRGLPGGSSLAKLLEEKRNLRNIKNLPTLTKEQILSWADMHRDLRGEWPNQNSGTVPESNGENWRSIDAALARGYRGLTSGSSIAQLLAEHHGARNRLDLPMFSVDQILEWADLHYERTGHWPNQSSGPVVDALGETWLAVNHCLNRGTRGLEGNSSLSKLLSEHRGVRNIQAVCELTEELILSWADSCCARTKQWPTKDSGSISEEPNEKWAAVDMALRQGHRGLPGGSSLARLLASERGVRNRKGLPPFTIEQILDWADAHHDRTGRWPGTKSGPIVDAPGETWSAVDNALGAGIRGLPGDSSLAKLIKQHRSS